MSRSPPGVGIRPYARHRESHPRVELKHVRTFPGCPALPGDVTCAPETPMGEVARIMATHHVHCVVVSHPSTAERRPNGACFTRRAGRGLITPRRRSGTAPG